MPPGCRLLPRHAAHTLTKLKASLSHGQGYLHDHGNSLICVSGGLILKSFSVVGET